MHAYIIDRFVWESCLQNEERCQVLLSLLARRFGVGLSAAFLQQSAIGLVKQLGDVYEYTPEGHPRLYAFSPERFLSCTRSLPPSSAPDVPGLSHPWTAGESPTAASPQTQRPLASLTAATQETTRCAPAGAGETSPVPFGVITVTVVAREVGRIVVVFHAAGHNVKRFEITGDARVALTFGQAREER